MSMRLYGPILVVSTGKSPLTKEGRSTAHVS